MQENNQYLRTWILKISDRDKLSRFENELV